MRPDFSHLQARAYPQQLALEAVQEKLRAFIIKQQLQQRLPSDKEVKSPVPEMRPLERRQSALERLEELDRSSMESLRRRSRILWSKSLETPRHSELAPSQPLRRHTMEACLSSAEFQSTSSLPRHQKYFRAARSAEDAERAEGELERSLALLKLQREEALLEAEIQRLRQRQSDLQRRRREVLSEVVFDSSAVTDNPTQPRDRRLERQGFRTETKGGENSASLMRRKSRDLWTAGLKKATA